MLISLKCEHEPNLSKEKRREEKRREEKRREEKRREEKRREEKRRDQSCLVVMDPHPAELCMYFSVFDCV